MASGTVVLLGLALVGALALAGGAYLLVGWLGVGTLGILIAFVAFQAEMDRDGPIGHGQNSGLYAASQRARDAMGGREKAAFQAEQDASASAFLIAKLIGGALAIAGLIGFVAVQWPR